MKPAIAQCPVARRESYFPRYLAVSAVVFPLADIFAVHGRIEADAHALAHVFVPLSDVLIAVGEVVGALASPHVVLPVTCQTGNPG